MESMRAVEKINDSWEIADEKENQLEKLSVIVKELMRSDDLRKIYQEEINRALDSRLKLYKAEGDISVHQALEILENLEIEENEIISDKVRVAELFDAGINDAEDIVINRELLNKIGEELLNHKKTVPVKYGYEKNFNFDAEDLAIYTPDKLSLRSDKNILIKSFIHEVKHFLDFAVLPANRENAIRFLRSASISIFGNVYKQDRRKAEMEVLRLAGIAESEIKEYEEADEDGPHSQTEKFIKIAAVNEDELEAYEKRIYEAYLGKRILELICYVEYSNDDYEKAADAYAAENAAVFDKQKILDLTEQYIKEKAEQYQVKGFNDQKLINLQKELMARTENRITVLLKKLDQEAKILSVRASNDAYHVPVEVDYARAADEVSRKSKIFNDINRGLIENFDAALNNRRFQDDDLQIIVNNIMDSQETEPARVELIEIGKTSSYKYNNNTIYIPRNLLNGDNRLLLRQLTHEVGHAVDFQKKAFKKKAQYLDSSIFTLLKNELEKKSNPDEQNRLLRELLTLKYRQNYFEMSAEKFSKTQANNLTAKTITEILSHNQIV